MALNFPHHSILPPEDNMFSANGLFPERNSGDERDGYVSRILSDLEIEDRIERDGGDIPQESARDILELLPDDPFGMDISSTFTAITGWFEDFEMGYGVLHDNNVRFNEYSCFWDGGESVDVPWLEYYMPHNRDIPIIPLDVGSVFSDSTMFRGDVSWLEYYNRDVPNEVGYVISQGECSKVSSEDKEPFHAGLFFALAYLGMRDLLSVGMVCKALYFAVHFDPLLWRNIYIGFPLNTKLNDGILLDLTSKSQGNLDCLSMVECPMITDSGLAQVFENNPKLTKLSVPGCIRLSIEHMITNIRVFNSKNAPGIKILRIGGLHGVTAQHYHELIDLLGTDIDILQKQSVLRPRIYFRGNFYVPCDDDRAIDIELCHRCENMRLVYDCSAESCKEKKGVDQMCKACTLCIARCVACGRCIQDDEYEETFCLEYMCSTCWKQIMDIDVKG